MSMGLDKELNMETEEHAEAAEKAMDKPKRKPFHYWEVRGKGHKLKLTTSMITTLENKYKRNIMNLVIDDGIPPLSVMLTIIQAALNPWEHGVTYNDVQKMFDLWIEDGGDQQSFYSKIVIPAMAVSGFFTEKQTQDVMEEIEREMDSI